MRSDGEKIQIRQQKKVPNLLNLPQEKKIRAIIWREMSVNTKSPAMYKRCGKESSTGTSMVQALAMSRRYALPEHLQHKM